MPDLTEEQAEKVCGVLSFAEKNRVSALQRRHDSEVKYWDGKKEGAREVLEILGIKVDSITPWTTITY